MMQENLRNLRYFRERILGILKILTTIRDIV